MMTSDAAGVEPLSALEYRPYELRDVTASERKMEETQRETTPSVIASVKQFLVNAAAFYTPNDAAQYGDALYGAMNSAGAQMAGLGPADTYPFSQLYSVTSASGFYQYNVSQRWKELEAEKLGVDWNDPLVFAAWKDIVTTGENMDGDMLTADSTALPPTSWLSPDPRMVIPPAPTREQGNTDFFEYCHVVSLAPEWYPDGLVRLNPPPAGGFIRPVSFDGMTSPLWVQQPPEKHAETGGGALETLNQQTIELSVCLPVQSYIVTDAMTAALKASPSVNLYSVDLEKAASGGTPENQILGNEEISIVQQVRRARTEADQGFQSQSGDSTVLSLMQLSVGAQGEDAVTPQNAKPRKRAYASIAELRDQMEAWAKAGLIEHRGQRFPAERFEREARTSPAAAHAIVQAAAELLVQSTDPRVLTMAAQLGDNTTHRPYYEAVLHRLENGVPDARGIRSASLREDLLKRLADRLPATDPTLALRAHNLLKREGRQEIRLAMLNYSDPGHEIVDVLAEVCQKPADPSLIARTARQIAARHPERLMEAAGYIARQKESTRLKIMAELKGALPDWSERHAAELTRALSIE